MFSYRPEVVGEGVLSVADVRGLRVGAQRLGAARPRTSVDGVLRDVFAVQAQDEAAAELGLWARSDGLLAADVARARDSSRSIVRTWCLRGTLHLVLAEDVRWLSDLLRPAFERMNGARRVQLGLDDQMSERGVAALVQMLAHGPLTRAALATGLAERGIPSQGQATIHIIWRAALTGLVCGGPHQPDGAATFVLLGDWVPPEPKRAREIMLAELVRRFLQAYGPARPEDLAAWSGLSITEARRGWAQLGNVAVEVQTSVGSMWQLSPSNQLRRDAAPARLLPAFDGLWLGYKDRDVLMPPAYRQRIYPGGGVIRPCVLVNGQPVGTWTRRAAGRRLEVVVEPFAKPAKPNPAARAGLEATVADLGRFLDRPTRLAP